MCMRRVMTVAALAAAFAAGGCGDDGGGSSGEESPAQTDAFTEAAPEAAPEGPAPKGELSESDRAAVESAVRGYIAALNRRDGAGVCGALEPGALDLSELPVERAGCGPSVEASIGTDPEGGGPAWRRTTIRELNEVALDGGSARVTATVTHDFSDRSYVSVEEDVIYLDRAGDRWLLAKPSGTLYRSVGYPEPPLRAFTPPD